MNPSDYGLPDEPLEYHLPCPTEAIASIEGSDDWLARMAQMNEETAREFLAERWTDISLPGLAELRDSLLDFHPTGIVIHESCSYLKLIVEGRDRGGVLYLGATIDEIHIEEAASHPHIIHKDKDVIAGFYRNFPGLRDTSPEFSGDFVRPTNWERFEDFGWPQVDAGEIWAQAVVLFNACNGDLLLLCEEGVAWAVLSTGQLWNFSNSFSEFLRMYARFLKVDTTLDSFSFNDFIN